jgi:hypothetical protein
MKPIRNYNEFVNESVNEGSKDEMVKKEAISRLSDFFRVSPGPLMKFKFDGNDNIKDLTKVLNSTSDVGTELYYKTAIKLAQEEVGFDDDGFDDDDSEDDEAPAVRRPKGLLMSDEEKKLQGSSDLSLHGSGNPQQLEMLVAKCLAAISNRNTITSRSLLTGQQEYTTLQVEALFKNGSSPDNIRDWQRYAQLDCYLYR